MNKVLIGVYQEDTWEFYTENVQPVNSTDIYGKKLYVILPDHFFYFFQTNITAKKHIHETLRAYAKNLFPTEDDNFIGFLKTTPIIGYILKYKINNEELFKKASIITTPFVVEFLSRKEPFIYKTDHIIALVDKGLHRYVPNNNIFLEKIFTEKSYPIITPTLKDTIKNLMGSSKNRLFHLNIIESPSISKEKTVKLVLSMLLIIILVLAGGLFRYNSAKLKLDYISKQIQKVYLKAFNGKTYSDPYGMLIYKSKTCYSEKSTSPLKFFELLSRVTEKEITIDKISYKEGKYNVWGITTDYDVLGKWIDKLKKIKINAKILSANPTKNILKFNIICELQ